MVLKHCVKVGKEYFIHGGGDYPLKKVPSDRRFEHICIRMKDLGATTVTQQERIDYSKPSEPSEGKQTSYAFSNAWGIWCGTYFPSTSKLEYRKKDGIKVWEEV